MKKLTKEQKQRIERNLEEAIKKLQDTLLNEKILLRAKKK